MNAECHEMTREELMGKVLELSRRLDAQREISLVYQVQAQRWQDVALGMRCAVDVDKGEAFARLTETVN